MIAINRLLAWATAKYKFFSKLIKGSLLILFEHGKFIEQNMSEANLCFADLEMSLRLETRMNSFESVYTATLETNGRISFVLLDHQQ